MTIYNYDKVSVLNDLMSLKEMTGALNELAERGCYNYREMYSENVLDLLEFLCNKYNVDFNKHEIDWEWCNYPQSKEWELEEIMKDRLLKVI